MAVGKRLRALYDAVAPNVERTQPVPLAPRPPMREGRSEGDGAFVLEQVIAKAEVGKRRMVSARGANGLSSFGANLVGLQVEFPQRT